MYSARQARLILIKQLTNFAGKKMGIFRLNNKNMLIEIDPLVDKLLNHELPSAKVILETYAAIQISNAETVLEARAGQEEFWKKVQAIYEKVLPQIELNSIRHDSEREKFGNLVAEIQSRKSKKDLRVGNF